ncbi:MAG: tannase/feruloyl esterase family alpha/beta hydrolase [Alphaproteobacteria bacterium]|nr:tannase/feruloyl esterase family alpha/beta hydrolase [Alphaproteobacteria bacterium]MBU1572507.1 tannase/feruloyl esterase family alpha/beta hydrolase [Alphaproteobacteria bacterium]
MHTKGVLITGLITAQLCAATGAFAFECSVSALQSYDIDGVTVTEATATASGTPACLVDGTVVTRGNDIGEGLAKFQIRLPQKWNNRFLMLGNGGLAGTVKASANTVDVAYANDSGYVTAMTDLGHTAESGLDASFALTEDGSPNAPAIADYYYRASHVVTNTAKAFAQAVYGESPGYSYLSGCSTGGRMAQVAASRYPDDFDGVISGAAFMDISSMLKIQHFQINQLLADDAQILPNTLPAIQNAVMASCDAVDGVTDGMIQNPAACSFAPESLICDGVDSDNCLTKPQAAALRAYFTALHTDDGRLVYPGYAPVLFDGGFSLFQGGSVAADDITAAEPWGNDGNPPAPIEWAFSDHIIQYLVMQDPVYNVRDLGIEADGTIPSDALAYFIKMTQDGNGSGLDETEAFFDQGKKMILYHGWGDHALSPFRTVRFVDDLARRKGGYDALSQSARLFMVPEMGHCSGGTGPDSFNTLAALENWVENDVAPATIAAEKLTEAGDVTRSMPLCPYPAQAHYSGEGDVNDASNWSCPSAPAKVILGSVGISAGLLSAGEPTQ